MHEAGLAEGVLKVILPSLEGGAKLTTVNVVAGAFAGVEAESLATWFTELSKGTFAEGGKIQVRYRPASVTCRSCDWSGEIGAGVPVPTECPKCQKNTLRVVGGTEFFVENVEVEQ